MYTLVQHDAERGTVQPINLWFNRNYASTYWTIQDIKERQHPRYAFTIFATHADPHSPVLQAAHHASLEPDNLSVDEYLAWCVNYCVENRIDVLVPVHHQDAIMRHRHMFEQNGVRLVASAVEGIDIFEDKAVAYEFATSYGFAVPPYQVAHDEDSFLSGYEKVQDLCAPGTTLVVKPIRGVGGKGFYILDNKRFSLDGFLNDGDLSSSVEEVARAYRISEERGEDLVPLMVMPLLGAPEISVDCLADASGTLLRVAPRAKVASRLTQFTLEYPEVEKSTTDLAHVAGLTFNFNAQWRWHEGVPVLLEVNTRASGGLFNVIKHTGENYVWLAVLSALGEHIDPLLPSIPSGEFIAIGDSVHL